MFGERKKEDKDTDESVTNRLICQFRYLSLVNMNVLGCTVGEQSLLPLFPSNTTLLVAREVPSWIKLAEIFKSYTLNLKLPADSIRTSTSLERTLALDNADAGDIIGFNIGDAGPVNIGDVASDPTPQVTAIHSRRAFRIVSGYTINNGFEYTVDCHVADVD